MRIYIGSDIHGSSANARRFFDVVDAYKAARGDVSVVILGDIYNHGPRNPFPEGYAPMQVAKMLNERADMLSVVRGNCDSEVDQMISDFEILPDLTTLYFGHRILFTHGHKCNVDMPKTHCKTGDIVFYGHFHRPYIKEKDGVIYVCVGAIGLSPDGVDRAYAVLDDRKISIYSLQDGRELASVNI